MKNTQLYLSGFCKDSEKTPKGYRVVLPVDVLILSGVVIVLLLTLSFSLGIEQGKKITRKGVKQELEQTKDTIENNADVTIEKADLDEKIETQPEVSPEPEFVKEQKEEKREGYHIQVASFQKERSAKKEAENLRDKGFPVVVDKKGKYVVVYVGRFNNETEAKHTLRVLKKKYKDCILRRL